MAAEAAPEIRGGRESSRRAGGYGDISPGAFGDNLAAHYAALADDGAQGKAKREVGMLASAAEKQLDEGLDHKEALKLATSAVEKCYEMGDRDAMADMLRLVIKAYLLRAGIARGEKAPSTSGVVAESLRKAEQIAVGELALFKEAGCVRGQAAMLLSSADIILDKRTGGRSAATMALQAAREARALFRKLGDKKMEAVALLTLVSAQRAAGEKAKALEAAGEALQIFREAGDKPGEAKALHAVAHARVVVDTYAAYTDALQAAKDSLALFEELGSKRDQATELLTVAVMNVERDAPEQAIPPAKRAIALFRQIGHDAGAQTVAVTTLIQAHQALEEEAQALNAAMEGLAWAQNTGDKRQEIAMQDLLAHVVLKNDDADGAMKAVKEGLSDAEDLSDKEWQGRLQLTRCQAQVRQQDMPGALKSLGLALQAFQSLEGAHRDLGTAHHMRADVLCMIQDFDGALEAAQEARDFFVEAEDSNGQGAAMLLIAGLYGASSDALETATQAQELFKKSGETRMESIAMNAVVEIHMASKDHEKALEVALLRRERLQEAGYRKEEAKSLHAISAAYLASGDAKEALRTAREGMKMARAEGDKFAEVHMSIQAVHASVQLAADAGDGDAKAATTALEEGTKIAKDMVATSKKVAHGQLNGPCFYWQAQALQMNGSPDAADAAQSALSSFERAGDRMGEAHSMVLLAQCNMQTGNRPKADELLQSALAIFVELGSAEGQTLAQTLMMVSRPADMTSFQPIVIQTGGGGGAASMAAAVKRGPDPVAVKSKIVQLVHEALEADDVTLDTPLMDSGLDSLASVSFRNEVSKEFSTTLPASLIFDYPTITSLTGYIIEVLEDQQ